MTVQYFNGTETSVLVMNDKVATALQIVLEKYADSMQASDLPRYVKWSIGEVLESFHSEWMDI